MRRVGDTVAEGTAVLPEKGLDWLSTWTWRWCAAAISLSTVRWPSAALRAALVARSASNASVDTASFRCGIGVVAVERTVVAFFLGES